jgi:hypothetical protein
MERDLNPPSRSFDRRRHDADNPFSRTNIVAWLRKTHGWIGLWGATLGLLFGTSGIWLNHRSVLQLKQEQERSNFQLPLPDPGPVDAQTMAAWLQLMLSLPQQATNVRVEPARAVAWAEPPERRGEHAGGRAAVPGVQGGDAERTRGREREVDPQALPPQGASHVDAGGAANPATAAPSATATEADAPAAKDLMQPEHWLISFNAPKFTVQAEYWVGNRTVGIRRTDNGLIATLTSLHKGIGMPVAWILLVDTLAGSLILLSLSGLALWMLTRRKRAAGLAIFGTALAVTAGLAIAHL